MSTNIEVLSAVHGIAPRSDELLVLGGDLERGRVSQDAYTEKLAQEEADWLQLQATAGIDIREDGKLRWQDHLRPIVKATDGFAPDIDNAPVTRWFETNTFYRQPTIESELTFDADAFRTLVGEPGEAASLLAPETFASLCINQADISTFQNVNALYEQLGRYYQAAGVTRLILEEYVKSRFIQQQPEDNIGLNVAEDIARLLPDIQVTYLRVGERLYLRPYNWITAMGLGVPNAEQPYFATVQPTGPAYPDREIWQQVAHTDSTQSDLIDLSGTRAYPWPYHYTDRRDPARLVLTNTVDFERLPLTYAREKVKWLGESAAELRDFYDREGVQR